MRKLHLLALLIFIAPLTLTACGQKGALYLSADETAQASGANAENEDAKKEDPQAVDVTY